MIYGGGPRILRKHVDIYRLCDTDCVVCQVAGVAGQLPPPEGVEVVIRPGAIDGLPTRGLATRGLARGGLKAQGGGGGGVGGKEEEKEGEGRGEAGGARAENSTHGGLVAGPGAHTGRSTQSSMMNDMMNDGINDRMNDETNGMNGMSGVDGGGEGGRCIGDGDMGDEVDVDRYDTDLLATGGGGAKGSGYAKLPMQDDEDGRHGAHMITMDGTVVCGASSSPLEERWRQLGYHKEAVAEGRDGKEGRDGRRERTKSGRSQSPGGRVRQRPPWGGESGATVLREGFLFKRRPADDVSKWRARYFVCFEPRNPQGVLMHSCPESGRELSYFKVHIDQRRNPLCSVCVCVCVCYD